MPQVEYGSSGCHVCDHNAHMMPEVYIKQHWGYVDLTTISQYIQLLKNGTLNKEHNESHYNIRNQ